MLKELRNKIILFFFPNFFDNFYQSMEYVFLFFKLTIFLLLLIFLLKKRYKIFQYLDKKNILTKSILSNTFSRIFLGLLALYNFIFLFDTDFVHSSLQINYFPKGVLSFFSVEVPSLGLLNFIKFVGILFSIMFIFGILEYFSSIFITLALLLFTSFNESRYGGYWGHGLNLQIVIFITYVLSGGMNGYSFAKKQFSSNIKSSNFAVIMISFSTGLVFLNAFFWKLKVSGINWAISDNLKYLLLTQRLYTYNEIENYIYVITSNSVIYQLLMFGGLISELLPIFFIFFIKKPILRFLTVLPLAILLLSFEYLLLLGGTLSWLFALVTFIDFEYFLKKTKNIRSISMTKLNKSYTPLLVFLFVQVVISFFTPSGFDYKFNTYPISQYPMFSGNYDENPEIKNKDYYFTNVYFEIESKSLTTVNSEEIEKNLSYPINQFFRDFNFSSEKNKTLLNRVKQYINEQGINYEKIDMYFITQKIPKNLNSEDISVIEKNKFAEIYNDNIINYDISIELIDNSPTVTYKNIITDDIKTIHLLSVTTHDFKKESFTPFQLEQLTDRLLSNESKGYKQIVIDLKNGETFTSGFCNNDFFQDC